MFQLAATIRAQLDTLAAEYGYHLREVKGYAGLPAQDRLAACRDDLELIAACLEAGSPAGFIQFIEARAAQRFEQGFAAEALSQALTALEKMLIPLVTTVEAAAFLWGMLSEARTIVSRIWREQVDLSLQQQVGLAWQRSQHMFQLVVDNFPGVVFWKDTRLTYLGCSKSFATGAGLASPEEIIGKTDYDLPWARTEAEAYRADDRRVMDSGVARIGIVETQFQADGEIVWFETNKIPLLDEGGTVIGILGTSTDITGRKQLEQQAQEALERRGRQVTLSTQVAQEVAAAANLGELYRRVVTQVKEQFGYYHTQLLRYDPISDAVVLVAGYGPTGARMLAEGHHLPLGTGLIGVAAATGASVLRADVLADPNWRANPLLPETRGELAVPIKIGKEHPEAQLMALRSFIASGYDAIAVAALTPEVLPIAREAMLQGIPVIAITNDLNADNQTAVIRAAQHELGYMLGCQAGEWARQHLSPGEPLKLGVLNYRFVPQVAERETGILDGIKAVFGPNIHVVGAETAGDPGQGLLAAEKWLQAEPELRMIVGINDGGALGAYQAAVAAGKNDPETLFIGGIDAVDEALRLIKEGTIYQATVDQKPFYTGVVTVRTLVAAIKGLPYDKTNIIECTPVNRVNVDEFLGVTHKVDEPARIDDPLTGMEVKGLKLGLSILNLINPFFAALVEGAKQEAGRLGVLLTVNDPKQILGVLDVQSNVAGALNAEDQLVLEGLCGQVAVAIEGTRLRQEIEDNLRELSLIQRQVSREGWQQFRDQAGRAGGFLFDQAAIQPADDLWLPEINLAIQRHALVVPAAPAEPSGAPVRSEHFSAPASAPHQDAVVAPLLIHDETVGVLGVYADSQRPLSPAELALVQSVSEQVTLALDSARLFEQTQLSLAETETLYQASASLSAAQNYGDILAVLQQYLPAGQAVRNITLNYFDRPWTPEQMPGWINVLALRFPAAVAGVSMRYHLADFSSAAQLLRSDVPILIEDVEHDPRVDEKTRALYTRHFRVKSTLFVPLVVSGQWLGYVNVLYPEPITFPEAGVRRLMAIAGQAAIATQTIYLFNQMQEALAETRLLYRFGEVISREVSLPAIYDRVVQVLVDELHYTIAWLAMVDEPAQVLRGVAGRGLGANAPFESNALPLSWTGDPVVRAAVERRVVTVNDRGPDPQMAQVAEEVKELMSKVAAVPIFIGRDVKGVIAVHRSLTETDIEERDERLLQAAANQMAIAIQRAQLFSQTQEALAITESLYEAGQRINAAADLQEAVAAVMEGAPVPAVNRAVLAEFEWSAAGELEAFTIAASWYANRGTPPLPVGTRYARAGFSSISLLLSPTPLFFADTWHDDRIDPAMREVLQRLNIRALIILPLWVAARQIGTLLLESEEVHEFTEQEIRPYLSLAPQVAVTVDNQRLLAATRAALAEVETTQQRYTLQAWETYLARHTLPGYEQAREDIPSLGDSLPPEASQALAQRQTTVVTGGNGHRSGTVEPPPASTSADSSLFVPLTLRGEVIGLLGLQEVAGTREWTPEEIALVEAVAELFAQTAESLRLLEDSQRRAAWESRVNEIGQKIRETQSLDEALQVAITEIGRSLQAPQTMVQLEVKQ